MVQGDEASQNLLVKAANESATHHEVLENFQVHVTYKPRAGLAPQYTYDEWPLSDGSTLSQNVGNANFVLARDDLVFVGGDDNVRSTFGRFYNSENRYGFAGTFGNGTHGDFGTIALERNPLDGSYIYDGPTGLNGVFHKQLDGTFVAPPGTNAVLSENVDGTLTLTFADTGEVWSFDAGDPVHHLVRTREVAGYQLDATYVPGWSRIATLSDSEGNTATFDYDMVGDMTTITDQNRAVHRYEYDNHKLTRYTAPTGDQTTYTYDGDWMLTRISLPDRRALKLSYWPGSSYLRWVTPVDAFGVDQPATEYDGGPGYTTAQRPGQDRIAWFYNTQLAVDLIQHGIAPALSVSGVIPAKNGSYDRAIAPYSVEVSSADVPDGVRQLVLELDGEPVDSIAADCSDECPQRLRGSLTFDAGTEPDGAYRFQVRAIDDDLDSRYSDRYVINVDRVPPPTPHAMTITEVDPTTSEALLVWAINDDPAAPDGTPGSGLQRVELRYRPTGGSWTAWSDVTDGEFILPASVLGQQIDVETVAVDRAGNASPVATHTLTVVDQPSEIIELLDYDIDDDGNPIDEGDGQLRAARVRDCGLGRVSREPAFDNSVEEPNVLIHGEAFLTCADPRTLLKVKRMKLTTCVAMKGGSNNEFRSQVCETQERGYTETAEPPYGIIKIKLDLPCRPGTQQYRVSAKGTLDYWYPDPRDGDKNDIESFRGDIATLNCNEAGAFRYLASHNRAYPVDGGWKNKSQIRNVDPGTVLGNNLRSNETRESNPRNWEPRPTNHLYGWDAHHLVAGGYKDYGEAADVQDIAYRCGLYANDPANGVWLRGNNMKPGRDGWANLDSALRRRPLHRRVHTYDYFRTLRISLVSLIGGGRDCEPSEIRSRLWPIKLLMRTGDFPKPLGPEEPIDPHD